MSLFNKLKNLFGGAQEAPKAENTSATPAEEPNTPVMDEQALAEAQRREAALLDRLAAFKIVGSETMARSFLMMHIYSFEKPFDGADMRTLVNGMRWLGFRLYSFSVRIGGEEHDCESWQEFLRHLAESEIEGCSLLTSFGGVRVNCVIDGEGSVHFSHDSSRGVDFSPFEGIFDPEEIEPEQE